MPIALTQVNPNMDWATLVATLNENFSLIQNQAQTTVYKDETGVNRIIIGKFPDGTWGIIVSKSGVDVIKLFNS